MIHPIHHNPSPSQRPARLSAKPAAAPVQFGSAATAGANWYQRLNYKFSRNYLVPFFAPVIEIFIWNILVQDVIALWVPRIYNSLTRGAFDYDPKTDPANHGKSKWQVFKRTAMERLKRLNWTNALEETWREIASGPAIFMWPTLVFAIGRRLAAKKGIELSYGPLTKLSDTFAEQNKANPALTEVEGQKKALIHFVDSLFGDTQMKEAVYQDGKTYGDELKQWANEWVEQIYKDKDHKSFGDFKNKIDQYEAMEGLNKKLADLIQHYNRTYKPEEKFYKYQETEVKWLQRVGDKKEWGDTAKRSTSEIFEYLTRWKDFAFHAFTQQKKHGYSAEAFPKVMEQLRRSLVFKKLVGSLLATTATLVFLFKLVKWTQSHNAYPANRRLTKPAHPSTSHANPAQVNPAILNPSVQALMAQQGGLHA